MNPPCQNGHSFGEAIGGACVVCGARPALMTHMADAFAMLHKSNTTLRARVARLEGALKGAQKAMEHTGFICRALHEEDEKNSRPFAHCRLCLALGPIDAALADETGEGRETPWVQCTTVSHDCLGGCRTRAEHERYNKPRSATPKPQQAEET